MLKKEKYDDSFYEINQFEKDKLCPQCYERLIWLIDVWGWKGQCHNKNCDMYYKKLEEYEDE